MAKNSDKIIIDTNLWISYLITHDLKRLDKKILNGQVKLVFSNELLEEFLTVAHRSKFKKYFTKDDLGELLNLFHVYAENVEVRNIVTTALDPKDNFLLALAQDSKADYLITGDKELLSLRKFKQTKIIKISDYLKTLK